MIGVVKWGFMALLGRELSEWVGLAMEIPEVGGTSAQACPKHMDLHNNQVGRSLAPTQEEMWNVLRHGDNPLPLIAKQVADAVRRDDTINSLDDPRMPLQCHLEAKIPGGTYVWRTKRDDKVRWEHAVREGKVFDVQTPHEGGNLGGEANCRCWAEPVKKNRKGALRRLFLVVAGLLGQFGRHPRLRGGRLTHAGLTLTRQSPALRPWPVRLAEVGAGCGRYLPG